MASKGKLSKRAKDRMEPMLRTDEVGDLYLLGYRRKAGSRKSRQVIRFATPRLMATKASMENPAAIEGDAIRVESPVEEPTACEIADKI